MDLCCRSCVSANTKMLRDCSGKREGVEKKTQTFHMKTEQCSSFANVCLCAVFFFFFSWTDSYLELMRSLSVISTIVQMTRVDMSNNQSLHHYWIIAVFQEPWHLQFIADLTDSNVYTLLSAKKAHGAPTDFGFCVKVRFLILHGNLLSLLTKKKKK